MTKRPIYVGAGECDCKRVDVRLYHVPGTPLGLRPYCEACLLERGYVVLAPRTAADIDDTEGVPSWREPPPLPPAEQLNLGHGHLFDTVLDSDDQLVGWLHTHLDQRSPHGVLCQSFCAVRQLDGAPVHQIVCADPLTLTPSLQCRTCGSHGHVSNGKWEPC